MLAYCGLDCKSCPVHLATTEHDKLRQYEMRVSIAEKCHEIYGMELKPEEITDCDGCRTVDGRLFSGCLNCEIRKCAEEKNIASCAFCFDYACQKLQKHFKFDPGAQIRLEECRRQN